MTNCDRPDLPAENPVQDPAQDLAQDPSQANQGRGAEPVAGETGNTEAPTVEVPSVTGNRVTLDPALLAELREVTDEPARAVDTAVRQWLQRRAIKESDTSRPLPVNPFVPPRGEWND
ncbi:MAG: hypothetical protein SNJ60_03015 [Pseudanabaenaceae cyanobacterium]